MPARSQATCPATSDRQGVDTKSQKMRQQDEARQKPENTNPERALPPAQPQRQCPKRETEAKAEIDETEQVSRALARHRQRRGSAPLSGSPDRNRRSAPDREQLLLT